MPARRGIHEVEAGVAAFADDVLVVVGDRRVVHVLTGRPRRAGDVIHDELDALPVMDVGAFLVLRVVHVVKQHQRLAATVHVLDQGRGERWADTPAGVRAGGGVGGGSGNVAFTLEPVDPVGREVVVLVEVEVGQPVAAVLAVVLVGALEDHRGGGGQVGLPVRLRHP